jgi:hypothetical protein
MKFFKVALRMLWLALRRGPPRRRLATKQGPIRLAPF